jgi:hypothetical protein
VICESEYQWMWDTGLGSSKKFPCLYKLMNSEDDLQEGWIVDAVPPIRRFSAVTTALAVYSKDFGNRFLLPPSCVELSMADRSVAKEVDS